ncbi:MAG TPA: DNA translocase FtsK 4TM domain-containing protein [Candidatus Saccharimonadia bacterium]|nr:DNA translocase FtsK 4TM domain-containing protein [Candidatus Saccharimonadia bacterium]
MATKKPTKTTKSRSASTTRTRRRTTKASGPVISPEAQREISAVFLGALALLLLFACFNFGGTLVTGMFHSLRVVFGFSAYALPLILGTLAWMLFQPEKYAVKGLNYLGFTGFLISLAALLHVSISPANASAQAQLGNGGGYIGYDVTSAMLQVLNVVAASIILIALLAIFLILATNTNLKAVFGALLAGFTKEKVEGEAEVKVAPEIAQLTVNDNSGAPATALPMRGELNVGGVKKLPTAQSAHEGPKEALTANSEEEWTAPSLDLLEVTSTKADAGDVKHNAQVIAQTLESFGINVTMGEVNVGPTVTQYTFIPPAGVRLNKITGLDTNLALSLAAHPIRIEAPIPGKSAVGVEIPNKRIATVRLRDVLSAPEIKEKKTPLTFVLGRDVSGVPMSADLAAMPHLLIAGATGSGKSVMINALLTSLLYRNSPADVKLILVDPKRVELGLYNKIPHLLTPVIVEPEKCISALKWAVAEMERRYKLLEEVGNRNIVEYNKAHKEEAMPYIVIIIDELADLMVLAAADVETLIVRLAQMARAVGIHLVLATQRPSVDVITGIIKANIPARLAFSVASQIDSRTILDQMGAEKLLGKGDMLFSSPEFIKPRRIQGVFVSEQETKAVTDYLRTAREPQYNEEVLAQKVSLGGGSRGGGGGDYGEPDDDMFDEAAEAVFRAGKASASMLQRRLRVGYARAARLLDLLEERGIIGPADGARPRDVLISSLDQVHESTNSAETGMRPAEPYDE